MRPGVRMRTDYSAEDLRGLARNCGNSRQCARLLALAGVAEGHSRGEAARLGGMDRQTLRDWVYRFNAEGPEGLVDRQAPGPRPQLTQEQRRELAEIVDRGPDPESDGVVRWRRTDLQEVIRERFGVHYNERHVSRLLNELGFSHMSARPRHVGQDRGEIEAYKKIPGLRRRLRSPRSRKRAD